ncbi:MAG TPA: hypothetical protein VE868_04440, partial [Balneolaceae bacterium]|nr:hypothetical protein [Balneolaceae bacterium]
MVRAPFKKADREAVHVNSTYAEAKRIKEGISNPDRAINGRCLNISKEHVQNCFEKAFGYPLKIDPTKHHGKVLKKSTFNYTHDAVIINAPIDPSEVEKDFVYERAINNETEDGHFLDYRVPVHGGRIPVVFEKYRSPKQRFTKVDYIKMIPTDNAFSTNELDCIVDFAKLMRMDFGELDVLRDNDNGKI